MRDKNELQPMNLKKSSAYLGLINGVKLILGLLFQILLARHFGISKDLDALFLALTIYNFSGIINLFLTSLFIPFFNEIRQDDEENGYIFADVVVKWTAAIMFVVSVLVWLNKRWIITIIATGLQDDRIATTVHLIDIMIFGLVFQGISATSIYLLNSLYHFAVPAITMLLLPVLNLWFLIFASQKFGIYSIAYASIIGNVAQCMILFAFLLLLTKYKLTSRIYHDRLPFLFKKSSQMAFSGMLWEGRELISRNIGSNLPAGSIALLAYAEKITVILFQIGVTPFSKIFYSKISELVAGRKFIEVNIVLSKAAKVNAVIMAFLVSGIISFLNPALILVFGDSRFEQSDIQILYLLLCIMGLSLIFQSISDYLTRVSFALKNSKYVTVAFVLGLIVFFVVTKLSVVEIGIYGVAVGYLSSQFAAYLAFYFNLRNKYFDPPLLGNIFWLKIILLMVAMIASGLYLKSFNQSEMISVFIFAPVFGLFFGVAVWRVFRNEFRWQ